MKTDFPLLKKWYEITSWIMDTCEKYPKSVRFTFSDRIINTSMDILDGLTTAIYEKNRAHILAKVNTYMEKIRIYMRLSMDKRYISIKQHEFISKEINEAGKMLGGWIKRGKTI